MNAVRNRVWALSLLAAGAMGGVVGCSGSAVAGLISPSSVTASSSYSGYPSGDAIDSGPNYLITDWAANGGGVRNYLDMVFPTVETLSAVVLTDRTTRGGGNGAFSGGTTDFTTEFELQAYTSPVFTTPLGAAIVFTKSVPVVHNSVADFAFTGVLGGLQAQYLRYTILAVDGSTANATANPGLANIQFEVPEPASLGIFALGLLLLAWKKRGAAVAV